MVFMLHVAEFMHYEVIDYGYFSHNDLPVEPELVCFRAVSQLVFQGLDCFSGEDSFSGMDFSILHFLKIVVGEKPR